MKRSHQIFVSYRREGGAEMARLVYDFLSRRGYCVFMDVEDLKRGPFNTALFDEIDSATDVVVVLGPGSLDRCHEENDWLRLEVAYAIKKNKNVIPVMIRDFQWPKKPLPSDIATLRNYQGIEPTHRLFKQSMGQLTSLLLSRPKLRRLWITTVISVVTVLLVVGSAFLILSNRFQSNGGSVPPPTTSRDIEVMTTKVLTIAHECMQDPSVIAGKRVELQHLAAKVFAEPRYREDAIGPTAALYRLVAASLFFKPTGKPDREMLKDGLYWLGNLRKLTPELQNDSQLKETEGFFFAFVEGRAPTWDAEKATMHAIRLALLGSKDADVIHLTKKIMDRAKEDGVREIKVAP